MESFINFFNRNAKNYASSKSHMYGKDLDLLISMLNPKENQKALDLGTGPGFVSSKLAEKTSISIGIDLTPHMLDIANKRAINTPNLVFVKGDVTSLPFPDNSFDLVTCRRVAHHVMKKEKMIEEARRVLKSGGKLGLTDILKPMGDKLNLLDKLEKIRDPTYINSLSLDNWFKLLKEHALKMEDFKVFKVNETFESWLSPVSIKSENGRKARKLLNDNIDYFKEVFEYDKKSDSFNKTRFVIIANK